MYDLGHQHIWEFSNFGRELHRRVDDCPDPECPLLVGCDRVWGVPCPLEAQNVTHEVTHV